MGVADSGTDKNNNPFDIASDKRIMPDNFGDRLRRLRMQHSFSLQSLAEFTRIPSEFLRELEHGTIDAYAALTDWQYKALADALKVNPESLLTHARHSNSRTSTPA
jgi:cytoskeletal protein RodZ